MKDIRYNLFKFSLLLLFLQSMFAWFLWGQLFFVIILCLIATFAFGIASSESVFSIRKTNFIPIFLIFFIQLYVVADQNTNALVAAFLRIIIVLMILLFNDKIKIDLFRFLTKSFAILLSISLFAWILFLLGISLPHFQTNFNDQQYLFDNYYLFLHNHKDMILPVPRFSSVFLEPGQLGMMSSFLLCANRFDLKRKEILVIFIATIFTFSLAAYLLLLISASVYLTIYSKKPFRNFILWGLFLFTSYYFFANYNNGDNTINNLIFSRFESVNSEIVENNRFSEEMDVYFKRFINSEDLFSGIGSLQYEKLFLGANAGYKVFLIQFGIIGTLSIFLFYLAVVLGKPTKMAWILLLVYILCFVQAAYPLWECELILFITAIPFFKSNNIKLVNGNTKTI
jgi:hypothetical protein